MRVVLVSIVLVSACFDPGFTSRPVCGGPNDADCPPGLRCQPEEGRCHELGCAETGEGEPCVGDNIPTGVCHDSICIPRGCGDNIVAVGEVCDDGNNRSGDGCSADCQSLETCGNGYL